MILHGLGTLARVALALPKDLARLEVRFAKPVYPNDVLTTSFWSSGETIDFETKNAAGWRTKTIKKMSDMIENEMGFRSPADDRETLLFLGKKPGDTVKVKTGTSEDNYSIVSIGRYADTV